MDQKEADEYMKMLATAIDLNGEEFLGRFVEFVLAYRVTKTAKIILAGQAAREKQDGR